jgi:hypothetical protein
MDWNKNSNTALYKHNEPTKKKKEQLAKGKKQRNQIVHKGAAHCRGDHQTNQKNIVEEKAIKKKCEKNMDEVVDLEHLILKRKRARKTMQKRQRRTKQSNKQIKDVQSLSRTGVT